MNVFYITIGLVFAGGTLYAVINAITPIMVADFMHSFFSQFGNENIFTMANECGCYQGLLEDGSRCLECGAFPESPDSKINAISDINDQHNANRKNYVPTQKPDKGTITKSWENNGRALKPSRQKTKA